MKISRLRKGKFNIIYIIGRKILFCSLCGKKGRIIDMLISQLKKMLKKASDNENSLLFAPPPDVLRRF